MVFVRQIGFGAKQENAVARIVLVADDSPTIQKKALGILKAEGFEVETVSNGVAAIKRLAVLDPVVILADVSMPGRDGYEVCEFVKRSAKLSHVPVLLVASDMEPYDEARGAEVGADGIIKKPFEPQELISIVMKFAEQFEASEATLAVPVAPPPAPQPAPEFVVSSESPDEMPTVVQHVAPDFSAVSEGVAFSEPPAEEASGYSMEPRPAEMEAPYPAPDTDPGVVLEPAPAPEYAESTPAPEPEYAESSHAPAPEYVESMPAAEPEYAESNHAPAPEYVESMPAAEPGYAESSHAPAPEYVESIPAPESQGAPVEETPLIREEPPTPSPLASSTPPPPARGSSYLDGLEAATTESAFVAEQPAQVSDLEGLEPAATEPVFIEEQPANVSEPHSDAEEVHTMIFRAPLEIAEPVWKDETIPAPPAPEPAGPSALEPQLATEAPQPSPEIPMEQAPEPPHVAPPAVAATSLDSFSLDDATAGQVHFAKEVGEVAPVEAAPSAPAEEAPTMEIAPPEPEPEAAYTDIAPHEAPAEAAPPEASAEVAAPPPEFDWALIYSVVHKVVVRMSPPALPAEAVEELARRLAEEIASEISFESSQPPEQ